jgi:beta-lactamase regulating signal transducer with metallopeptidase domain
MGSGLLLAFPLESVALRLVLALGVALVLLRLVSSWDLRSPRARSVLAVSPFVVAVAVVLLSSRNLGMPSVLVPSGEGAGSLAVPIADRYLDFAPMAPIIVAVWGAVSLTMLALRGARAAAFRREMLLSATAAEPRVAAVVLRLARALAIAPPRVLMVDRVAAGAAVVGVRDPLLVLDADVLTRLDDEELEGVLAHELAHVARRDNLVAWAAAVVRDVAFFVPGATWAVRAMHREREAAADADAVRVTGRPAALASGLLQVVGGASGARRMPHGCAALVPDASVIERVRILLREEQPTTREHRIELALAAAVSLVAVAAALVIPTLLAGEQGQRDALGVLVGAASEADVPAEQDVDARVFAVYREIGPEHVVGARTAARAEVRPLDIIGPEDRPGMAQACAAGTAACSMLTRSPGLALRPAPIVLIEQPVGVRWQATPVSEAVSGDRFAMYWLSRLEPSLTGR